MTRSKLVVAGVAAIVMVFVTACSDDAANRVSGPVATESEVSVAGGSIMELTDQSAPGLASNFRVTGRTTAPNGAHDLSWTVNGKRFVDMYYPNGAADGGRTGTMTLYDKDGAALLSFDAATRKFVRLKQVRTTGPIANDYDFNQSHDACGDAWVALIGSGSMLTLMIAERNNQAVLALLPGVYAAWQLVDNYCGWLYREFAWEFMNPILHIDGK